MTLTVLGICVITLAVHLLIASLDRNYIEVTTLEGQKVRILAEEISQVVATPKGTKVALTNWSITWVVRETVGEVLLKVPHNPLHFWRRHGHQRKSAAP